MLTPQQRAIIGSSIITSNVPGSVVTSGYRTPAKNAAVGGVPNSDHLKGLGVDFVPPQGMSNADAINAVKSSGADIRTIIDEGDHIHVSFNDVQKNGLNYGQSLLQQGKDALKSFGQGAAETLKDPVGAINKAVQKPIDDWVKRIGLGLVGFVMITAVVFALTKVDPIKLVAR